MDILSRAGGDDLEGYIKVAHALSLNDTFWVKGAEDCLQWAEVSLYTNPFDKVIGAAAFDGSAIDSDFSSTSPEYSTDGGYAKCWVRENNTIKLYKAGSQLHVIESFSEFFCLTDRSSGLSGFCAV